jgi:hypothetical protein
MSSGDDELAIDEELQRPQQANRRGPPQRHHQHLPRELNATSVGCSDGSVLRSDALLASLWGPLLHLASSQTGVLHQSPCTSSVMPRLIALSTSGSRLDEKRLHFATR